MIPPISAHDMTKRNPVLSQVLSFCAGRVSQHLGAEDLKPFDVCKEEPRMYCVGLESVFCRSCMQDIQELVE